MVEPRVTAPSTSATHERSRLRRTATRVVAAGGVVVATLAVAAPSWAGPMTGC